MTQMIELVDNDIKTFSITVSHMLKKLEERLNMLNRHMEDFFKIKLLEKKHTDAWGLH